MNGILPAEPIRMTATPTKRTMTHLINYVFLIYLLDTASRNLKYKGNDLDNASGIFDQLFKLYKCRKTSLLFYQTIFV